MAKALGRYAPIIIGGIAFTAYVLFELNNPPAKIADIPSAPAIKTAQAEPLAYCAGAILQARRAGYLPESTEMSPEKPRANTSEPGRASCVGNAGDQYFQVTYDKVCDQSFEPGCTRLISAVRAGDGQVLYIFPENSAKTVR